MQGHVKTLCRLEGRSITTAGLPLWPVGDARRSPHGPKCKPRWQPAVWAPKAHAHDGGGGVVGQQLGQQGRDQVHAGQSSGLASNLAACIGGKRMPFRREGRRGPRGAPDQRAVGAAAAARSSKRGPRARTLTQGGEELGDAEGDLRLLHGWVARARVWGVKSSGRASAFTRSRQPTGGAPAECRDSIQAGGRVSTTQAITLAAPDSQELGSSHVFDATLPPRLRGRRLTA